MRILDLGCGFAPLAHSLAITCEAIGQAPEIQNLFQYTGVDIRKDAIDFLSVAYHKYANFEFILHQPKTSRIDYIGGHEIGKENDAITSSTSEGLECTYHQLRANYYTCQWSNSLLTHLTPQGLEKCFESIFHSLDRGGISINCCLIANTPALTAMAKGIADRRLPLDMGTYYTYSQTNPLLCTAYKPEFLFDLYRRKGLQVLDVQYGHWRGDGSCNEIENYIDIIIARKS